jgi:hypothetical protein
MSAIPSLPAFDFDGPDWAIRWPADLIVEELDQLRSKQDLVGRVLVEAFVGQEPVDEWTTKSNDGGPIPILF